MNKNRLEFDTGIFTYNINNNVTHPHQGWKIHISATPKTYKKIFYLINIYCNKHEISFKYIKEKKHIQQSFTKEADVFFTGKGFTLYPINDTIFKQTILDLYIILHTFKGPYIVTDKQYKNSVIYYRYGIISPKNNNSNFIVHPDGSLKKDKEHLYYSQPDFINDPLEFDNNHNDTTSTFLLKNKYHIEKTIHLSNFGGVYLAIDTLNNKKVIIKEARPYLGYSNQETAIKIRKNEKQKFVEFKNLTFFPNFIEDFFVDNIYFLVMEYVEGTELSIFCSQHSPLLFPKSDTSKLNDLYPILYKIFNTITEIIENVNQCGYIVQDISQTNFFITENHNVKFIDLETVVSPNSKLIVKNSWSQLSHLKLDKLNLLLLFLNILCPPANENFKFNNDPIKLYFLINHFFNIYHVPNNIRTQINNLILIIFPHSNVIQLTKRDINLDISHLEHFTTSSHFNLTTSYKKQITSLRKYDLYKDESILEDLTDSLKHDLNNFHTIKILGLKDGCLGLADILIELFIRNKNIYHLVVAKKIIKHIINFKIINNGIYTLSTTLDTTVYSPYIANGTGGLIKTILKYLKYRYDSELENELFYIVSNFEIDLTQNVDYYYGLTGILDCYIDIYQYTSNKKFLKIANNLYDNLSLFKYDLNNISVYPSHRYNNDLSKIKKSNSFILTI